MSNRFQTTYGRKAPLLEHQKISYLIIPVSQFAPARTQRHICGSAVLRFRKQVLIECLWNKYALKGELIGNVGKEIVER
jgi:hypothetical protein